MASIGPFQAGQVLSMAGTRIGFLLVSVSRESTREAREVLGRYGLKPRQLRVLDLLADRGPIGQRELGEIMDIDQSILVNLLNPLEADRLIKRERDTADRRRHVVTVTSAGTRRLAQADRAFRDAEDAFFAPLTQAQRDQLLEVLVTLRDAHRSDGGDDDH